MQASTPLPWGGGRGGYLLFSFTNAFAGRGVLRSKSIAVGNTRVLGLLATHWLWGCYEKRGKIQRKIMAKSVAICVISASKMRQNARWNDADEPVSWCRWACNLTQIARQQAINDETKAVFSLCNSLKTAFPFLFRRFLKCLFNALFFYIFIVWRSFLFTLKYALSSLQSPHYSSYNCADRHWYSCRSSAYLSVHDR